MSSVYVELNDKAWLRQKYEGEKLSAFSIATIIKCTAPTVIIALRRLGIPTRTHYEACSRKGYGRYALLNNIFWLRRKYEVERLSLRKVAELAKCSNAAVSYALHRGNVYVRTVSESLTGDMCTEARREKYRKHRRTQRFPAHHTRPELQFEAIYTKNNLPFEFTGDSKVWIGNSSSGNVNPDFVGRSKGKRFAVFVNGDYWHSPLLKPQIKETQRVEYQIKQSKKHRWIPIILWETDLKREDAEAFVLSTLKREGFDVSCTEQQQNAEQVLAT
jgi:G:T-mismatch repair DNA endonuclease (very short patch repair protein)